MSEVPATAGESSLLESATNAANSAVASAKSAVAAAAAAAVATDAKSAQDAANTAANDAAQAEVAAKYTTFAVGQAKLNDTADAAAIAALDKQAADSAKAARSASTMAAKLAAARAKPNRSYLCTFNWNDCDWQYWVIGGGEESESSSQDSQTNPFISLFVRAPSDNRHGNVWLLARFLGAANANNTNNVVAATQSATGSSSTSGLPQVGTAVDYTVGLEHDWFMPSDDWPDRGGFTIGGIVGFGATTPLSAQHATAAYVVPAYGTNECNELIARFPTNGGITGLPAQPSTPYITTTTTPMAGTSTSTTSGPFCIINPVPITTTTNSNGSTSTVTVSGTAQTNIAFAPEDRNSFLLKYFAGVRLINRWHNNSNDARCAPSTPCTRTMVDLTVGQDETITGGMLRHFVGKAEAAFPVPKATSICFFGSAAWRFSRNQNLSPLILQPATIVTSSPNPPATITLPSTSTWILPLTQPNRDFYRIGIGIDLTDLIAKAFSSKSG